MRRPRKRRRQNSFQAALRKHAPTVGLAFAFCIAVASAVGFILPQLQEVEANSKLVEECVNGSNIRAHTVVLLDVTDTYSTEQRRNAGFLIRDAQKRVPLGGKFSIYLLNENAYQPEELLSACRPKNENDINPIAESAYGQTFAWLDFINSVQTELDDALSSDESARSPIMEAITIVRDRYDFSQRVVERRLIIVSDMLQFSDAMSLYDRNILAKAASSSIATEINPIDLRGISVEISAMRRPDIEQQTHPGLAAFWHTFFSNSGVSILRCAETAEICIFDKE